MGFQETKRRILTHAAKHNIPAIGEFELTGGCNFACAMCYVHNGKKTSDLDTKTWKRIFKEAVDAGLLFGVLTGGEPLSRDDFPELYTYLHDMGVRVTIFTNASLLDEDHMVLFKRRPPESVVITLYGSDEETYRTVTNVSGGFNAVTHGLDLLEKHRIPHRVRTLPLNRIYDRLDDLIAFAEKRGLTLEHTRYVTPFAGGDIKRLSPKEVTDFDRRIREAFPKGKEHRAPGSETDNDETCLAGRAAYFIDHRGYMQPCSLAYLPKVDVKEQTVALAFNRLRKIFSEMRHTSVCGTCRHKENCLSCFARRLQEGDRAGCSEYLLSIAEASNQPLNAKRRYEDED